MSCDTKLPGCKECCHAIFQPIDPDRFWALETVFVASPSILFLLYANRHRQKVAAALEALPDHKNADSKRFSRNYFSTHDYGLVKSKTRATLISDKNEETSIIWTDHLR